MQLVIKKGRKKKIYTTDDGGLVVTTVHPNGLKAEDRFEFERIRRETTFFNLTHPVYLIFGGIVLFILIAGLSDEKNSPRFPLVTIITFGSMTAAFALAYWLHRPKVFVLKTSSGNWIQFPVKGNENEISSFVEYVIRTRNTFLKLKYGTPNEFISYDSQYSNFNILLREGVITQNEYTTNIQKLSETFKQHTPQKTSNHFSQN